MADKRRAAATAGTGYALIATGAALRGHSIDAAHAAINAPKRVWPPVGAVYSAHQLRAPGYARIGRRFLGGTALVTLGAPAAAKGTYDLLRRRPRPSSSPARPDEVAKARRSLVGEGVAGTGEALQEKAESLRSGAPAQVRAVPVAVGGATAGAASLTAHRLLDLFERHGKAMHPRGRNVISAAAAVPGALASLPVSRRLTRRSGYQVTPTGVRKSLRPTTYDAPDYRGRHTPVAAQRAAIYSASALPLGVGTVAGARTAGRYAPPGKERHTSLRQFGSGPVAGNVAGVAAGVGLAQAANRNSTIGAGAQRLVDVAQRAKDSLHLPKATGATASRLSRVKAAVKGHRSLEPVFGTPRRAAAALVGYSVAKPVVGQLGGAWAMRENQRDQRRYNARHFPVHKADTSGMSQRQREQLARRKRIQATASVVAGTAGLGALGLLVAAKHPKLAPQAAVLEHHRNSVLAVGAGVSGAANFNFAGIQRREAREDVKRPPMRALTDQARRNQNPVVLAKTDRIHTTMNDHEARRLVRSYGGLSGPLPAQLDRQERMRAYEARYVASGGKKVQRWQHRAQAAEVTRNAGLAGGAAAGAAWLVASSRHGQAAGRVLARHLPARARASAPAVRRHAERSAVGAATIGATAELAGEYARRRRANYTSAPGGVAASALRRMQAYTPEGSR